MRIAHVSDLHFGRLVSDAKLGALREDILEQAPELVVVSGDITDRGRVSQFRDARDFLRALESPYISVPGNREVSFGAFWEWMIPRLAMKRYSSFFGAKDRVVHVSDEHRVVIFGLNSVHGFPSWPGKLSRETRYWLKEVASGFDGYAKALVLHHPVLPVIRSSSFWAHSFSDAGEALNICAQCGISLIMQGHKHRSAVMEVRFPEMDTQVVVSAGGAPLLPYWDCAYHMIRLKPDGIVVQPREYKGGRFVPRDSCEFENNRPGNHNKLIK